MHSQAGIKKFNLKVFAKCPQCGTELQVESNSIVPSHLNSKGSNCKGAGYSGRDSYYLVETQKQATGISKWLKKYNDPDICLGGWNSYPPHSLGCGDGKHCAEIKNLLVQALVAYVLK